MLARRAATCARTFSWAATSWYQLPRAWRLLAADRGGGLLQLHWADLQGRPFLLDDHLVGDGVQPNQHSAASTKYPLSTYTSVTLSSIRGATKVTWLLT